MTTILVTEKEIAHDARGSSGGGLIISDEIGKSIGWKNDIYIGVGNAAVFLGLMYNIVTGKPHPRWKVDGSGFVIISREDGTVETLSVAPTDDGPALRFSPIVATPIGFGSGSSWALAATDHGKSIEEAVVYATQRDNCSGGEVTVLKRNRKDNPIEDYNLEWIVGGNLKTLLTIREGYEKDGVSVEDFDYGYVPNMLFQLSPIALEFRHHPSKIANFISRLSDRITTPFETIAIRWGFQIEGKVGNLHKLANNKQFADWLVLDFYKPQGLQTNLLTYMEGLKDAVELLEGLDKDYIEPLRKYTRSCIGNTKNLTTSNIKLLDMEIDPLAYRKPFEKLVDRTDNRSTCKVDDLVTNNKEWFAVEKEFLSLTSKFKDIKATEILNRSSELARDLVKLSEAVEQMGETESIVGSANFKHLILQIEALAFVVDTVGVVGYLIQQLETSLQLNVNLMLES